MQHPGGVRLALLLLAGLSLTEAVEVEVRGKDNKTCIYAVLSVNFTILYEGNVTMENATFPLPNSVSSNGSICGGNNSTPLLKMGFGTGHSLSLNFSHSTGKFRGDVLIFTYNTSDAKRFPGAKNKSVKHVAVNSLMDSTPLNTIYTCRSVEAIASEAVVMTFWNVSIQAFVENGTIGKNESVCRADLPTTVAPITTRTTPIVPTPVPTKPPPELPAVGNYTIKNGSDPCLLASMGLQLNITYTENKTHLVNIDSNSTASGYCGDKDATLVLEDMDTTIQFNFIVDQSKFFLKEVKANVSLVINGSRTALNSNNSNLRFWQAFVGSSYMCHKEQSIVVTDQLVINAFNVWVQPFQVKNGTFSRAEECSLDDDSILIPVVVGAALAGLIVIVVIAYMIGRRKSYAGYQTL
ncbi:lysosome-associated membrane glycoprotein 2-like isoform X2 [Scyliorhinus canicula]|uniref:lysosome-associated membrane glycoprotein 2-like isoform X2 n=1 Tax=Scyliorhinus canicula TaxID=7830 RepID=UPI0018F55D8F|nr:lysosome-associated membrane glycoprotein 2-like isoform X2 [Scyliorhinus canicula]